MEDKKRQSFLKTFQEAWETVRDEKLVASAAYLSVNSGATFQVVPVEPKDKTHTSGTLYLWGSPSAIPPNLIQDFGEKAKSAEERAIFVAPCPQPVQSIDALRQERLELVSFDDITKQLVEKAEKCEELSDAIKRKKAEIVQRGGFSQTRVYLDLIEKVEISVDNNSKKKSLEELIAVFAQDLGLKDVEVDKKTPSSEIDVIAKNHRDTGFWRELGTPILFEAKNWAQKVSAKEVRDLKGKATPAKSRFLIAWNGITGKNELNDARLEIIKAKSEGRFIIVLYKEDFKRVAGGIFPETIVEERYYSLIVDKIPKN